MVKVLRVVCRISVPNFTTFYCMDLWAAIDFQRRRIYNRKRYKHYGCFAASLLGPQL